MRDDAARESFKTETGRVGVTLCVRSFLCCFGYLAATGTMFNSKGLEYDDVSPSFFTNLQPVLTLRMCIRIKVILYNFFEESASDNLWRHHRRVVNDSAASRADSESSLMTIGHASVAHGIDSPDDIPSGDQQTTGGLAEYTTQDIGDVGDSEEPDKTKGARVIQKAARRYILRRKKEETFNDTLTKGRNRLFKSCKVSAKDVHVKYRKIYLGPVPHLLLCLEWIVTRAQDSKDAIKARRVEATLQEKSDLIAQHKLMR